MNYGQQAVDVQTSGVYECKLVAVYGTLRTGKSNHGLLRAAISKGTYQLKGHKLYVMSAHTYDTIPFIVATDNVDDEVTVELFEQGDVPWDDQIEHLDWLENHPEWYTRVKVSIGGSDVWVYRFEGEVAEGYLESDDIQPVPTGDWCDPTKEDS